MVVDDFWSLFQPEKHLVLKVFFASFLFAAALQAAEAQPIHFERGSQRFIEMGPVHHRLLPSEVASRLQPLQLDAELMDEWSALSRPSAFEEGIHGLSQIPINGELWSALLLLPLLTENPGPNFWTGYGIYAGLMLGIPLSITILEGDRVGRHERAIVRLMDRYDESLAPEAQASLPAKHSPLGGAWRSALLPGWGQVYSGRPVWWAAIVGTTTLGLIGYGIGLQATGSHPYADPELEGRFLRAGLILYGVQIMTATIDTRPDVDQSVSLLPSTDGAKLAWSMNY